MKKEREEHTNSIPNIEVIDLDNEGMEDALGNDEAKTNDKSNLSKKQRFPRVNLHILLLAVFVIFILGIAYKIINFGEYVDQKDIFSDGQGTYEDTLDSILPLMDANGQPLQPDYEDGLTIVAFGNAPFADDRNSKDNLANMIAEMTGATVYNCSISGSYMASETPRIETAESPMDLFTFYWLATLGIGQDITRSYNEVKEVMGEDIPPEANEVINTLTTLDFDKVDVVVIMYDATDYLMGHEMYSDQNSTDIQQFTGNMEAGIELFQSIYPHIRIIVLSPPYAYSDQLDENGNYISSDIARYGWDVLSTYVIKQSASCAMRGVTFIDNLYGTITEDNADEYLIDNLHLNSAGRREIANRFVYALKLYDAE